MPNTHVTSKPFSRYNVKIGKRTEYKVGAAITPTAVELQAYPDKFSSVNKKQTERTETGGEGVSENDNVAADTEENPQTETGGEGVRGRGNRQGIDRKI